MNVVTTISVLFAFATGLTISTLHRLSPVPTESKPAHNLQTNSSFSHEIQKIKAQLDEIQSTNTELKNQYIDLKFQLAETSSYASPARDKQSYENNNIDLPIDHSVVRELQPTARNILTNDKEYEFYSQAMDSSQTSISYEILKMGLLNSQSLQQASLENLECRGNSCMIKIHQPTKQLSYDDDFERQFELAAILRQSGFKSSTQVSASSNSITLLSSYQ